MYALLPLDGELSSTPIEPKEHAAVACAPSLLVAESAG